MTLDKISRVHLENNTVSAPDECQEFFTGLWIFPEYSQHCAGYCFTVHFLYPTHYHTHMPRRNENGVNKPGRLKRKSSTNVSHMVTLNSGEVTKPPYPEWTSVSSTSAVLQGTESQIPRPQVLPSLLQS